MSEERRERKNSPTVFFKRFKEAWFNPKELFSKWPDLIPSKPLKPFRQFPSSLFSKVAISVSVLVAIFKKELNLEWSLSTIFQILSISLFEKTNLSNNFSFFPKAKNQIPISNFYYSILNRAGQQLVVADLLGANIGLLEGFYQLFLELFQKLGHVPLRSTHLSRRVLRPGKDCSTWRNSLAIFIVCDSWR